MGNFVGRSMQQHAQIDITVHWDLAELREDWMTLQSAGATTLYQTYEWCHAWHDTIGMPNGVQAQIVAGRGTDGKIKFILPLATRQHGSYRIVEWLAAQIATYGLGVYDPLFLAQSAQGLAPYWKAIVAALPDADGIWLNHLPETWCGRAHPLGALFTTRSANQTHQITLQPNYAELYETKRSASSRRGAQRRDKQLEAVGDVTFGLPASDADAEQLIDEMIEQHARYLAVRGVHNVLDGGTADFLKQLTRLKSDSQVSIFPQYLHVDGKLVSAKLGFIFDRVYWAMISSLDAADLHRYSPGDYALRKTIAACCERGLETFDFATGDSSYKDHWSDCSISLHEIIQARTARGMLWAAAKRASIDAKRVVKNSAFLWPKLTRFRKTALGHKS